MKHITDPYLLNPTHRITINLIGLGGTGSQVLTGLYRMNEALIGLGHPGLLVRAWDPDIVADANIGRQLFSTADVGFFKSDVLITRLNRYAGYDWLSSPCGFNAKTASQKDCRANITITCVDTIKARLEIHALMGKHKKTEPNIAELYWLDYGNQYKTGQVVLGTIFRTETTVVAPPDAFLNGDTPKTLIDRREKQMSLKNVVTLFPELAKMKDKATGASCSIAQALGKQDLFINSTLANVGLAILWKLFREGGLDHHGAYLNLDTLSVNPIKIAA